MGDKHAAPDSEKLKVLLVDDHRMFRAGLRMLLEKSAHWTVVGEASTGEQAFALATSLAPDLVVMDIHLPDVNGIVVSRRLLESMPSLKIVALSSDPTGTLVHEAMLAGIAGYVLKENATDELERALGAVRAGKIYLCPEVSTSILDNYRHHFGAATTSSTDKPTLSARETELLRMIADGMRNKEIAAELELTVKSAETYRQRLMKKLKLDSTAALTRYAIREGIVKP